MNKKPVHSIAETVRTSLLPAAYPNERFNYYSIPDLDETNRPSVVAGRVIASAKNVVSEGVVLVSKLNPRIKRVWKVSNEDGRRSLASTEFIALKAPQLEDVNYLYYALQEDGLWQHLRACAIGSTNSHTRCKPKDLEQYELTIAEPEQRPAIARILGVVDGLIERTEALVAKQQQIKQGLLHDLFTRGVDAQGRLRPPHSEVPELYHETALGWLPKGWGVEKLGARLKSVGGHIQTGPFGSQLHAHEYTQEGVPVIMPQDINDAQISTASIARIDESRAVMLSRHRVDLNDVVLARRGDLSRAACISENEVGWVCGTGCLLLRAPRARLNGQWLALVYGHSFTQRHVEARAIGSTMLNVSATLLSGLVMAFPEVDEQNGIAERVDSIQALIDINRIELAKLHLLKSGLMQDLLTGRVPVDQLVGVGGEQ